MVSKHIDPIPVPKICVEPVSHANLHAFCEAQVVIAWQAAYELPPWLSGPWLQASVPPVLKEYVAEATVFAHPVVVAIALVLLLRRLRRARRPLAAAVEQVAQEEHGIGVEFGLYSRVGATHVLVGVLHGERVERPWSAGICVRVDELGVGDEDESMGICSLFLA